MSELPAPEPEFSGIDLANSFLPAWAKPTAPASHAPLVERYGDRDEDDRRGPRRDGGGGRGGDRRPERGQSRRPDEQGRGRRDEKRGPGRRDDRREPRAPAAASEPVLQDWAVTILPDPRGIEGLAKQIKSGAKAYPIFDLAALILEKPERYSVKFQRLSERATPLFEASGDKSLWLSEGAAMRGTLARDLEKYYRRDRVQVEPPKGAFSFIAVCGMSDTVLGPPNYHDYQLRLRKLHSERFPNVPFDVFKSRVRMVKEPEFLEKWKEEQSTREEFVPLQVVEGEESPKLADMRAVETHFRAHYASAAVSPVSGDAEIPGPVALHHSDTVVRQLAQKSVLELRRFPLPLAHIVGQQLAAKGLQIFKAHENITYVSVARPRHLDRQLSPVAEGLAGILDYLESHASTPRADQWKDLVSLRTSPEDPAAREAAVAGDLSWLIHQGHVVDYARKGLEAVRKPKQKPTAPPAAEKESTQPVS